ncbi:MAG: hypothetical protein NXI21_01725 [Alphaproteobacteria bacterium]|nr:hypothetical protein [Alphaproteobacteria bacterium]
MTASAAPPAIPPLPAPNSAEPFRRQPAWELALAVQQLALCAQPFAWGAADCLTTPADAVLAITGVDPLAPWRGRYRSRQEAEALLAALAPDAAPEDRLSAVVAAVMAAHGAPHIAPAFAQHGDVALCRWPEAGRGERPRDHCGFVSAAAVMLPARRGLTQVPLAQATAAWRIG